MPSRSEKRLRSRAAELAATCGLSRGNAWWRIPVVASSRRAPCRARPLKRPRLQTQAAEFVWQTDVCGRAPGAGAELKDPALGRVRVLHVDVADAADALAAPNQTSKRSRKCCGCLTVTAAAGTAAGAVLARGAGRAFAVSAAERTDPGGLFADSEWVARSRKAAGTSCHPSRRSLRLPAGRHSRRQCSTARGGYTHYARGNSARRCSKRRRPALPGRPRTEQGNCTSHWRRRCPARTRNSCSIRPPGHSVHRRRSASLPGSRSAAGSRPRAGRCGPSLLEALLLLLARLLLARPERIVGGGLLHLAPAEEAERAQEQPAPGAMAGTGHPESASQSVEVGSVHRAPPVVRFALPGRGVSVGYRRRGWPVIRGGGTATRAGAQVGGDLDQHPGGRHPNSPHADPSARVLNLGAQQVVADLAPPKAHDEGVVVRAIASQTVGTHGQIGLPASAA